MGKSGARVFDSKRPGFQQPDWGRRGVTLGVLEQQPGKLLPPQAQSLASEGSEATRAKGKGQVGAPLEPGQTTNLYQNLCHSGKPRVPTSRDDVHGSQGTSR